MNAIGFVFAILSILSLAAFVSHEKQEGAKRLRSSYLGHVYSNREILNLATSECYKSLRYAPSPSEKEEKKEKKAKEAASGEIKPFQVPAINPECARLNLSPLIERNLKEGHFLYDTAAKLLKTFYGKPLFNGKASAEYRFLDAFLQAIRERLMKEGTFALEKIEFRDSFLQSLYYKMLKGTKGEDSYPSLLEYVKVEPVRTKICISHAHPNLLAVLFSPKTAPKLYEILHAPKAPIPSQETIERICLESHLLLDSQIFDLLDLSRSHHPRASKTTLVGMDPENDVSLKKTLILPRQTL